MTLSGERDAASNPGRRRGVGCSRTRADRPGPARPPATASAAFVLPSWRERIRRRRAASEVPPDGTQGPAASARISPSRRSDMSATGT